MNPSSPNGNKKGRAKTKIFACLCPCSVFEYVDTDGALRKKDHVNPGAIALPESMRTPCSDALKGIRPGMGAQQPILLRNAPMRGRNPPVSPVEQQQQQQQQQAPAREGNVLNKPLKIVMEEVDCTKMDFSKCPKNDCSKQPCVTSCPPTCYSKDYNPCCQPRPKCPAEQKLCPLPICPPPCPPPCLPPCPPPRPQTCPPQNSGNQQCPMLQRGYLTQPQGQSPSPCRPGGPQGQQLQQSSNYRPSPKCQPVPPQCTQSCPPGCAPLNRVETPKMNCPEVTKRIEMKLDQAGKLIDNCTPNGSPKILKVEKDESSPCETVIKITYCSEQEKEKEPAKDRGDQGAEKPQKTLSGDQGDMPATPRDSKVVRPAGSGPNGKPEAKKPSDGRPSGPSSSDYTPESPSPSTDPPPPPVDSKPGKPSKKSDKKPVKSPSRSITPISDNQSVGFALIGAPTDGGLSGGSGSSGGDNSLSGLMSMKSTEAILRQLQTNSGGKFGIGRDDFFLPSDLNQSEMSRGCLTPQNKSKDSIKKCKAKHRRVVPPNTKSTVGKKSNPLSNVVVRETKVTSSKPPLKSPIHLLFGTSGSSLNAGSAEFQDPFGVASAKLVNLQLQMRRRNMRVFCSSSIKREVRPPTRNKRFQETSV